ncbi:MAG TPA: energy transducer TonB, partial [Chitinophagales bacterium]|nr:energy transducer TonB [Chitinophagales bacterium]
MRNAIFFVLAVSFFSVRAQQATPPEPTVDSLGIYTLTENQPEFTGGQESLIRFLQKNLRYPSEARENGIEGKVVAQFVVNENGAISDIRIIRGIGGGCDEEIVRVIKLMPNWKPGIKNAQPVKAYTNLPCTFKLGTEDDDDDDESQEVKFVGGESAYQKFLKKHIEYPKDARKNGVEGIVVLTFKVNENGMASDVKVSKSLSASCDQEALRLFSLVPTWSPQKKDGRPVAG